MTKYKVVNQRVEINGVSREIDTILEESEFKSASGAMVPTYDEHGRVNGEIAEKSELESLLESGHVVPVEE